MKKLIALFLIIAMTLALAACGSENTAQNIASNKLVLYSPHPLEFINPLVAEFEAKSGIKVEVIAAGTGELLKRVESEKENPLGDVVWGGSLPTMAPMKDCFETYRSTNEADVLADYKNTEGMLTRFSIIPSVLMVNKNLVGNIPIRGYADLLNPALKGKIAFADPAKSSSSLEHLNNMLYAMGNGNPENGWGYVSSLSKNLNGKLLSGSSAVYKGVADGEYTVGLTFEEGAANYVKSGAPVELVYMSEGTVFTPDVVTIIKNAKNMDNAKKFVDFLTGKDAQTIITTQLCRRSVRTDVPANKFLKPLDQIKIIQTQSNVVDANKQIWLDKFKDIYTQ